MAVLYVDNFYITLTLQSASSAGFHALFRAQCNRVWSLQAENFMFKTEYEDSALVMIDFGLATAYKPGQVLTTLCGSPRYMAPEVLK